MRADTSSPLLLHPAGPLAAEHAPGGGSVDLTLFPASGEPPVRVRLTGHQVQLLMVSVRSAQQSAMPAEPSQTDPARAAAARGGLSEHEWLKRAFSPVLLAAAGRASSSRTSARSSGTSNSAATASAVSAAPSETD